MKKTALRIVSLVFLLLLVFSLCACKAKTSGGAQSSNEGLDENYAGLIIYSSEFDLGEVETIVDESGEPYVTPQYKMRDQSISFLSHWSAETSVHLIAYMEKYGGPNINFVTYSYGECGIKLQAMVLAENAPDVYKLRGEDLTSLLFSDVWSDISNDFDWNNRNWRDLIPYLKHLSVDGKVLAAPEVNANNMIYFNKSIFEEYGIEDPLSLWEKGEWTKDNFDTICRKLTIKEGGNTAIYGFGFDHWWFTECLAMFDAYLITFDGSKYIRNTDDPKIADAFSYINQMGSVEKLWSDMSKATAYFASGKQAMLYYGNWLTLSEPFRSMALEGKIDFVPVPENTTHGLGPRQDFSIGGHAIPVGAKNREGAKAFIEIFNFYKQTPELDMVSTEAECKINAWTLEQFFRMRAPRRYKNPYTNISIINVDDYFVPALNGENWYVIKESIDPKINLILDSIPALN